MKRWLMNIVFLAFNLSVFTYPVDFNFKSIKSENGLTQNEVVSIYEDSYGFMWFGTLDGLNRYDGYEIRNYYTKNEPNSLINNRITSIIEDRNHQLWLGTVGNGVNIYIPEKDYFVELQSKLPNAMELSISHVFCMEKDDQNNIYVGSDRGLFKVVVHEKQVELSDVVKVSTFHFLQDSIFNFHVRSIEFLPKEELLILGTDDGFYKYYLKYQEEVPDSSFHYGQYFINTLSIDQNTNTLWLGTQFNGLIEYSLSNNQFKQIPLPDNPRQIMDIAQTPDGILWVASRDKGLYSIGVDSCVTAIEHYNTSTSLNNALTSNLLKDLFIGNNGCLWIGTIGGGVCYIDYNQKKFHNYKVRQPGVNNYIRDIYIDNNNNHWLGTQQSGLVVMNPDTKRLIRIYENSTSDFIGKDAYCIIEYGAEKLCVGTGIDGGINFITGVDRIFSSNPEIISSKSNIVTSPLNASQVLTIFKESDSSMWLGTWDGLKKFQVTNGKMVFKDYDIDLEDIEKELKRPVIQDIEKNTTENVLLLGTFGLGLIKAQLNEEFEPLSFDYYEKDKINSKSIRSIQYDKRDNLWIGTDNGLYVIPFQEEKSIQTFTVGDGLPHNFIRSIIEDDSGVMWVGTVNGLARIEVGKRKVTSYYSTDGLGFNEFSGSAVTKDKNGTIYFGGVNGIIYFNPDEIKKNTVKPKTYITRFLISDREVLPNTPFENKILLTKQIYLADKIIIPPKHKTITIQFSGIHFSNPLNNSYEYRLEGYDEDWRFTNGSNRRISYTNLPPDKYNFTVRSYSPDGILSENTASIQIIVLALWWKSKIAIIGYLFALFTLIYMIIRYLKILSKTRQQLNIEKINHQKQEELHTYKQNFFTNISHEIRNPVSLLSIPLALLRKKTAERLSIEERELLNIVEKNTNRLLSLTDEILDFQKSEAQNIKLNLRLINIPDLIFNVASLFQPIAQEKNIDLKVNIPEKQSGWIDKDKIEKILHNLLSNAIKYARSYIYINYKFLKSSRGINDKIQIYVVDDGKGIPLEKQRMIFERYFQTDDSITKGYGIGLAFSKSLAEAHQGKLTLKSKLGFATQFCLEIPISQTFYNRLKSENIHFHSDQNRDKRSDSLIKEGENQSLIRGVTNGRGKSKLLIMDDNSDMQEILYGILHGQYIVRCAGDGEDGWHTMKSWTPDLIICDIMMPVMDGLEFCKKVKIDHDFRHIPIILLTAKTDTETKYKGTDYGADDYITKPFDPQYLLLKINKLLVSRNILKEDFSQQLTMNPSPSIIPDQKDTFLKKVYSIIEKKYHFSYFNVDHLYREMGMSRTAFYNKMKIYSGSSGNEIILKYRMKKAEELLSSGNYNVSEVSYMIGYENTVAFSRNFKKKYGFSPREFLSRNNQSASIDHSLEP